MENKDFTKADILKYFEKLNKKLKENGQNADILIAGGTSMALVFDELRVTKDIDAVVLNTEAKMDILRYVDQIAEDEQIQRDWFNESVKGFFDWSWPRDMVTAFSNLNIYSVPAEQLLAMKLTAAREDSRDQEDAIKLMKHLDVQSEEEVLRIMEDNIPSGRLTVKMEYFALDTYYEYENTERNTLLEMDRNIAKMEKQLNKRPESRVSIIKEKDDGVEI